MLVVRDDSARRAAEDATRSHANQLAVEAERKSAGADPLAPTPAHPRGGVRRHRRGRARWHGPVGQSRRRRYAQSRRHRPCRHAARPRLRPSAAARLPAPPAGRRRSGRSFGPARTTSPWRRGSRAATANPSTPNTPFHRSPRAARRAVTSLPSAISPTASAPKPRCACQRRGVRAFARRPVDRRSARAYHQDQSRLPPDHRLRAARSHRPSR